MQGNRPAAVPLLVLATLLVASAIPAAAAVDTHSGRIVIISYAAAGMTRMRRLEDEVAREVSSSGWVAGLGGEGGHVGYAPLEKNRPACPAPGQCAAKGPGGSYTRPCVYKDRCGQ